MPSQEAVMEKEIANVSIGARFVSDGDCGTVKYIGEVPPTTGVWLGVEWDIPDRGKHDGSHQGTRYFQCRSATSGSFLRPKKADFGIDLTKALSDRYVPDDLETGGIDTSTMYVQDEKNKVTVVEMVGASMIAKKQSSFENLQEIDLRETKVCRTGSEDFLKKLPNITELNISKNLIPSWEEVSKMTRQMPKLILLNLSENRLVLPSNPVSLATAFSRLQDLVLNNMDLDWEQVMVCAPMWPQLRKLFLCYNKIAAINRVQADLFQHLELLNLESNQITDWQQVNLLGHLPKLQSLLLAYNPLSCIAFHDVPVGQKTALFPHLHMLSISHCKVNEWDSFNELDKLQRLKDLRYKKNPILDGIQLERAEERVIAKIAGLTHMNRCQVFEDDRKGAELVYLKTFCADWLKSGGSREPAKSKPSQQFLEDHPRYEKLVQLYGAAEDSEMRNQTSALKDTLIVMKIRCPDDPSKRELTKKLPGGMEVTKLKSLLHRLYKIDVSGQKLSYISHKAGQEIELDNDLRPINYFSIETGDTLLVRW
ncbi:tubulin-specific chaperone E-like isoform X2 [Amphiura filiformis]|uniref:tubulin-specific chaperone E-like isoform X1 n=1 Tax=Amphiura filiformis TaxID=82378 RepID=UPI003B217BAA